MINISYETNKSLYEDYNKCLHYLSYLNYSDYKYPNEKVKFHQYSEVKNDLQLLTIESYFATQNQEHTELILWSDYDITENIRLTPYKDRITFRVFNPVELAKNTDLISKPELLLAKDSKHYMMSGLLRFLALYKEGGVWFDNDMVLLRDLKPILDQEFAYVWAREFKDFTKFGPCAAFMGIKKQSKHAQLCIEELINSPVCPNSTSRDCDMLARVYERKLFTVFPSAFFNTEWQMEDETRLRKGWFTKTKESEELFLDAFAWHWHGSGGDMSPKKIEEGSKFDLIRKFIHRGLK